MTNTELLAKIKAEIERLKVENESIKCISDCAYCTGYDDACNDLLSSISTLESEKSVPADLEKAAEAEEDRVIEEVEKDDRGCPYISSTHVYNAFVRGAKWQKEQIVKEGNVILAEEDFNAEKEKSMEWGYNLCKEQMMKEAEEGEVENASFGIVYLRKNLTNDGYSTGDKVRVFIVKEN